MLNMKEAMKTFLSRGAVMAALVGVVGPVYAVQAEAAPADAIAAAQQEVTAHGLIRKVTQDMLAILKTSGPDTVGPEVFQQRVLELLEPVVDFEFIARSVMGGYSKLAKDEQKAKFVEVFKKGLVSTYSKGVSGFTEREIVTLPPDGDIGGQRRVSVNQEIAGPEGVDHLSYTMAMNREGEWKLINVVLNGVNLGKTFRNQFSQAMAQNKNDIDSVINNWGKEG